MLDGCCVLFSASFCKEIIWTVFSIIGPSFWLTVNQDGCGLGNKKQPIVRKTCFHTVCCPSFHNLHCRERKCHSDGEEEETLGLSLHWENWAWLIYCRMLQKVMNTVLARSHCLSKHQSYRSNEAIQQAYIKPTINTNTRWRTCAHPGQVTSPWQPIHTHCHFLLMWN